MVFFDSSFLFFNWLLKTWTFLMLAMAVDSPIFYFKNFMTK